MPGVGCDMIRLLSVAHLSAITLPPADLVHSAAKAGFSGVGLRLLRVTDDSPGYPLQDDRTAMRATQAALRETGLSVRDIEFVRITPEVVPAQLNALLDAGAELGARHLICAPYDDDLSRLTAHLDEIAELSAARGIRPVLEFFPWTPVPDLATCWKVVQAAAPEVGLLVDCLHFDRSDPDLDLLREIPEHRLPFAHVCDAVRSVTYTTDELLHTARAERLPPGEGELDLHEFLDALPPGLPLSVEAPMTALTQAEGPDTVLRCIHDATRKLLDGLPSA